MQLIRDRAWSLGVYGRLYNDDGLLLCNTLEHAYPDEYLPKLPDGNYKCVRGRHRLGEKLVLIETFEITNVPKHTGILFHVGNYQADSNGCVLVGDNLDDRMLVNSYKSFQHFMKVLECVDMFKLIVTTHLQSEL